MGGKGTKKSLFREAPLQGLTPIFYFYFLFSLLDINFTVGLLPPRRHVVWRDSVGVESSRSGLKSECADIFHQSFLCCYAILTSPKEGETAVYGLNPALF